MVESWRRFFLSMQAIIGVILTNQFSLGSQGGIGLAFSGLDVGEDEGARIPGPPGPTGPSGVMGPLGLDGVDGDDSFMPGPTGPTGATGPAGPAGSGSGGATVVLFGPVEGDDASANEVLLMGPGGGAGSPGPTGATGAAGPAGPPGISFEDQPDSDAMLSAVGGLTISGQLGLSPVVVVATGRVTAQAAAVASVVAFTVGPNDGSFEVSMNLLVTAWTAGTVSGVVTYTDEGVTANSLTMTFSSLAGVLATTAGAAAAFEGVPLHLRVRANTVITITTTVNLWTGTYNCEGIIRQLA
jgi:hypothetical protein